MNKNIFVGMKNGMPVFCDEDHYYEMTHTSFIEMNGHISNPFHSGTVNDNKISENIEEQEDENSGNGK